MDWEKFHRLGPQPPPRRIFTACLVASENLAALFVLPSPLEV
jgi:hypothetical protein